MRLDRRRAPDVALVVVGVLIALSIRVWGTLDSLDTHVWYSQETARRFLDAMTSRQRDVYLRTEVMDLAFLTVYSLLLLRTGRRAFPRGVAPVVVTLIPGAFDLVETVTILRLLSTENPGAAAPAWLGLVTALKWTSGAVVLLVLIGGRIGRP